MSACSAQPADGRQASTAEQVWLVSFMHCDVEYFDSGGHGRNRNIDTRIFSPGPM